MLFYNEKIFKRCFNYKGRYWYKNIKYIPLYFKLMHHLIKYGYDEYAEWETFNWFIDTMKVILPKYKTYPGAPLVLEGCVWDESYDVDENEEMWNSIVDRMIELLDLMDERNPKYEDMDWDQEEKEKNAAKDEFFGLFSKYFYNLWD